MIDNLRRSLVAPSACLAIVVAWLLPGSSAWIAEGAVLAALILSPLMPVLFELGPPRRDVRWSTHLRSVVDDLRLALLQILFSIAFLADRAWRQSDAIVRSLWRMAISRRRLLEWTTAAQSARGHTLDRAGPVCRDARFDHRGALIAIAVALATPLASFRSHRSRCSGCSPPRSPHGPAALRRNAHAGRWTSTSNRSCA